jgi:hypothetical protein
MPSVPFGQLVTAALVRPGRRTGIEAANGAGSHRKDSTMTTQTKSQPTHRAYAVTKYGDKKFWQPIGAMWAHQDGKGFGLRLDYLPLNGAQIVIRSVDDEKPGNGAQVVIGSVDDENPGEPETA